MNHWNGNPDTVMSAIMSMTTPPSSDNGKKKKNDKRVPVKEINCKGCGEPGDILLTCKSCSIVYHPLCDDPPRDEELVKDLVDWKCRSCRNRHFLTANDEDDEVEDGPTAGSALKGPGSGAPKRVTWKDLTPATGPVKQVKAGRKKSKKKKPANPNVLDTIEKIMKIGVEKCKTMNPSNFEIPASFRRNDYVFPGTSRSTVKKATKRNIIDLESETVPKPTALCFECGLSCRKAPLILCDYCPSYFHFDCLSPPLTTPPGGIWMCPLHPEPFLESVRLTTPALSERIRLWDITHRKRESQSVVLSFMSKTQRNPLYSFRKRFPYSAMFFPSDNTEKPDYSSYPSTITEYSPLLKQRKLDIDNNTEITKSSSVSENNGHCSNHNLVTVEDNDTDIGKDVKSAIDVLNIDAGNSVTSPTPSEKNDTDFEAPVPEKRAIESSCIGFDLLLEAAEKSNDNDERRFNLLKTIPLEHVYNLAFQRLKDLDAICAGKTAITTTNSSHAITEASTASMAQFNKKTAPLIQFYIHNTASQLDITSTGIEFGLKEASKSYYSWLNPLNYVNCCRISSRDLFVFFDPLKLQWEFLTYSPYGVVVDSVLHILQDPKLVAEKKSELYDFKMSIFEKRGLKVTSFNPRNPGSQTAKCECDVVRSKYSTSISHESGGILTVGSTIRVGCLRLTVKRLTVVETSVNGDAA